VKTRVVAFIRGEFDNFIYRIYNY